MATRNSIVMFGIQNQPMMTSMKGAARQARTHRRVVFVNRYYAPDQSATSQLLTDLTSGLVSRGVDVHVVASRQLYDDAAARLAAREDIRGVTVHRVATTRFGRDRLAGRAIDYASFYWNCAVALLKLARRGDVIVAETDPPLLSLLAAPVARVKGAALVNWEQDIFPEVASELGLSPLPRWLERRLARLRDASLRSARMNVVIGKRMSEYLAGRGVPRTQLCVIENWSDAIEPKPAAASLLRARLDLMERFVVCYSGNLGRAHEFDTLLAAARALEGSAFTFLIIGAGAKMDALKRATASAALDNFIFMPHQPRESLSDSLAAADVHIASLLPALEGLIVPSKLYGILAAGRPIVFVGDAQGEVGRVIERARCGSAVRVGDAGALIDVLRRLQAEPDTRALMGERARRVFTEEFTFGRALDRWTELINGLTCGSEPPERAYDEMIGLDAREEL
jgi:colanic acid biosynthesis glycosyl transferase WcaI